MFVRSFAPLLAFVVAVIALPGPSKRATCSNGRTASNAACCVWFDVLDDLQGPDGLFDGAQCGEEAHESLRLTFHDAIGISQQLAAEGKFPGGGADGSIMAWSDVETAYHANIGVDEIIEEQRPIALRHNVSFGDFIQFTGAVGVSNCAGGPRLSFMTGRPNISQPAPNLLVPEPDNTTDELISRFNDAGLTTADMINLLVSHTVAAQDHVDSSIPGTPFDSTPSEFDAQFFVETLLVGTLYPGDGPNDGEVMSPLPGEFRLQSDFELARDSRTACQWQSFITDHTLMVTSFEQAMAKMSVLGNDVSQLIDCSEVIPVPGTTVDAPHLPAGKTLADIQASCAETPFPSLSADPGPGTTIPPVPGS